MAPKETPVEALEAMNKVFAEIHADADFMADINAMGLETPEDYDLTQMKEFISAAEADIMSVIALAES